MSAAGNPAGWGRFGADDEHGALNLVTSERTIAALGLVREGRVLSLAQPLSPKLATAPHRRGNARYMLRDAGDYAVGARTLGGFCFAEDVVQIGTHNGTHVDALCHTWRGDQLYNGHPAAKIRSTQGAQRLGAETLLPVLTRGVLLDLVALNGGEPLPASSPVGRAELEAAAERAGVVPDVGDAILLHTGWSKTASPREYFDNEPGLSPSGAEWLAARDVSLVGADNYAVEVQPTEAGTAFPVHLKLMHESGIPLLENLELAQLAMSGAGAFLFVFAPLPLEGSTASPINPLAVL
jgi:kynurenine formamidase